MNIALARIQLEERVLRREALERDLSGKDAQECLARIRRRMTYGSRVWIPPIYNPYQAYLAWRKKHRNAPLNINLLKRA